MKMNNYFWLIVYLLVGGFLVTSKDEFWYDSVSRKVYILMIIFWLMGFISTLLVIIIGLSRQF